MACPCLAGGACPPLYVIFFHKDLSKAYLHISFVSIIDLAFSTGSCVGVLDLSRRIRGKFGEKTDGGQGANLYTFLILFLGWRSGLFLFYDGYSSKYIEKHPVDRTGMFGPDRRPLRTLRTIPFCPSIKKQIELLLLLFFIPLYGMWNIIIYYVSNYRFHLKE